MWQNHKHTQCEINESMNIGKWERKMCQQQIALVKKEAKLGFIIFLKEWNKKTEKKRKETKNSNKFNRVFNITVIGFTLDFNRSFYN